MNQRPQELQQRRPILGVPRRYPRRVASLISKEARFVPFEGVAEGVSEQGDRDLIEAEGPREIRRKVGAGLRVEVLRDPESHGLFLYLVRPESEYPMVHRINEHVHRP